MGYKAQPVPSLDAKRDTSRMDAAEIALLTREYVPEAIGVMVALMRNPKTRDNVRLRASTKLIELAVGDEEPEKTEQGAKIYILATPGKETKPAETNTLTDELRRRLGKGPSARRKPDGDG